MRLLQHAAARFAMGTNPLEQQRNTQAAQQHQGKTPQPLNALKQDTFQKSQLRNGDKTTIILESGAKAVLERLEILREAERTQEVVEEISSLEASRDYYTSVLSDLRIS